MPSSPELKKLKLKEHKLEKEICKIKKKEMKFK